MANRYANVIVRIRASRNVRRTSAIAGPRCPRGRPVYAPPARSAAARLAVDIPAVGAVVVMKEDLFERRLAARQAADAVRAQSLDQRADTPAHLEPQGVRTGVGDLDPRQLGLLRRRP